MKTYLGISFESDKMKNWEDEFDVIRNCDDLLLISKKTYEHCEDEGVFNKFKYKYVIIALGADSGLTIDDEEQGKIDADCYMAYIVPDMDYIHESKIKTLKDCFGLDHLTIEEAKKALNLCDFAEEGYGVCIGDMLVPSESKWNDEILNGFTTAIETVNSLLGFYLDRYVNRIGMTGWNFLEITMSKKEISDFICK